MIYKQTIEFLLLLCLLGLTLERTQTLGKRCPIKRAQFISSQFNDSKSAGRIEVSKTVSINGTALFYSYLNNDTQGIQNQLSEHQGNIFAYIIPMAIGIIAILVFSPLAIFCLCKSNFFSSCCLKNKGSKKQQNRQQKPKRFLFLIVVLICAATVGILAAVISMNPKLQEGYSQTRCAVAMFMDDLIYGNYTRNGQSYFIGIKPLADAFGIFNNLFSPLQTNMGESAIDSIIQNLTEIKSNLLDIPRGDGTFLPLNLHYPDPINSSFSQIAQINQIDSDFNLILGSRDEQNSLISNLYNQLEEIQKYFNSLKEQKTIKNRLLQFFPPFPVITFNTTFMRYASIVDYLNSEDKRIDDNLELIQNGIVSTTLMVVYIIAAVTLALCVLMMVTLFLIIINKFKKKLIPIPYVICTLLSFLGVLVLVLSIGMSAITITNHYACQYADEGLQNQNQFKKRFVNAFQNPIQLQFLSYCVTRDSTGILFNLPIIASSNNQLGQSEQTISIADLIDSLQYHKLRLISSIHLYRTSQYNDLASVSVSNGQNYYSRNLKILQKLSNPSLYECSQYSAIFAQDSWVPTNTQNPVYVACKANSTRTIDRSSYNREQFYSSVSDQTGCIDTNDVLSQFQTRDELVGALASRYPYRQCTLFIQQMANVWQNYYKLKYKTLIQVQKRASNWDQKLNLLIDSISQNLQSFQISRSLLEVPLRNERILQSITITSLNCKVLGQDMDLIVNTFCTQVFNYGQNMRAFMTIAGFLIFLFMLIFSLIFSIWKSSKTSTRTSKQDGAKPMKQLQVINNVTSQNVKNAVCQQNYFPNPDQQIKTDINFISNVRKSKKVANSAQIKLGL